LTGRENIYINGSVLGLSKKEIDAKIDEIIDFAEIREAIDMPVQNYSSGMAVRLGFSVASCMEPDIMILDEVLAVGDAKFRAKCYNKMDALRLSTATIFVSHSMEQIGRICNSCLVLEGGGVNFYGDSGQGMGIYRRLSKSENEGFISCYEPCVECNYQQNFQEIEYGQKLEIKVTLKSSAEKQIWPRLVIFNETAQVVAEGSAIFNNLQNITIKEGQNVFKLEIDTIHLQGGDYNWSLNLHQKSGMMVHGHMCGKLKMKASDRGETSYQLPINIFQY
jgi:lipopolysaccharide transport system ATP-binding protein